VWPQPGLAGSLLPLAPPERPDDDAILAQQNAIRAEQASKLGYVGDCESLAVLKHGEKGHPPPGVAKVELADVRGKCVAWMVLF
jgi:hypothetical protein